MTLIPFPGVCQGSGGLAAVVPRLQEEQGHQQVQPLVVVVQVQIEQLVNLLQPVGQGGTVDNQSVVGFGNVSLVDEIGPEGVEILNAVPLVVAQDGQQGAIRRHFHRDFTGCLAANVMQRAFGKGHNPLAAFFLHNVLQGDVRLPEADGNVVDIVHRVGDT